MHLVVSGADDFVCMEVTTTTYHFSPRRLSGGTKRTSAAAGMSDDDDDVPLFDEEARAKNAASLHATGMSDQARCCFIDIYIYIIAGRKHKAFESN